MNEQQNLEVLPPVNIPGTQPPAREIEQRPALANVAAPMTAAQAKVDAVANLTFKAYERAATLELTEKEIAALEAVFPDNAFRLGAGGDDRLIYIEHASLRERLNQVFRPGQWAIIPRNRWAENFKTAQGDDATRVYVEAMLVVRGAFVAEAVGDMVYYPHNAKTNYGDAVEGAKSACLRRCAKELGIGLQAWKKEFCEGWMQRNGSGKAVPRQQAQPARPTPPPATPSRPASQAAPAASHGAAIASWKAVAVPKFFKKTVATLGEMKPNDLRWWAENFEPKPYKGSISQSDKDLRAALDLALNDLNDSDDGGGDPGGNAQPESDDIPF